MSSRPTVTLDVFGEGKTDLPHDPTPQPPRRGVLPILLHALCGSPDQMLVKRHGAPFMQRPGTLPQTVRFAKRQSRINGSAGAVFVMDSESDLKKRRDDLNRGRAMEPGDYPMAVGVAHPCIEAWLLADARAIRRACDLSAAPAVPHEPEQLPAPRHDRHNNPKTALAQAAGSQHGLSAEQKDRIAAEMKDLDLVRQRCPLGFAPFADEVEQHIRPLF